MNPIKFVLILLFISLTSKAYSQYTDVINSNRPGASRSAYSVGTNVLQFEAGPYFVQEKEHQLRLIKSLALEWILPLDMA